MVAATRGRVSAYRKWKRALASLNRLLEIGVLTKAEYRVKSAKLKQIYTAWMVEVHRVSPPRPRGRPKGPPVPVAMCRRSGCEKAAAPGQAFCSREHAPLGFYGLGSEVGNG